MFDKIDVFARYQGLTQSGENLSFIGLRIGYNFSIKYSLVPAVSAHSCEAADSPINTSKKE